MSAAVGRSDTPLPGHAGAAPALSRVLAQARWESIAVLRNGEQLLLTVLLPLVALVGLSRSTLIPLDVPAGASRVDLVAPGVLAVAVLSTAFTGQAIATAFDRRHGVLRLLGTTPLGRSGLVAGRVLGVLVVQAVQLVVLGGAAMLLGWSPEWSGVPAALFVGLVGTVVFVALGLLLGGTVRAEGVLAVANLVWVLLVAAGGVLLPSDRSPDVIEPLLRWTPSGALGDGLREALLDGHLATSAVVVLVLWAVGAVAACRRWFRWD